LPETINAAKSQLSAKSRQVTVSPTSYSFDFEAAA
jgi:hypothetical protein